MKDGGPAFPQADTELIEEPYRNDWPRVTSVGGMSLRDWFAGQALASFSEESRGVVVAVNNKHTIGHNSGRVERESRNLAEAAYVIADAMLKAREGRDS